MENAINHNVTTQQHSFKKNNSDNNKITINNNDKKENVFMIKNFSLPYNYFN